MHIVQISPRQSHQLAGQNNTGQWQVLLTPDVLVVVKSAVAAGRAGTLAASGPPYGVIVDSLFRSLDWTEEMCFWLIPTPPESIPLKNKALIGDHYSTKSNEMIPLR
jgi:hypothetical protein